mmetsp:Transcript_42447/g.100948  ORF Transcript_42447/g.100948 Transcript_42447/m.100948 type:complete len:232 (+) Transcript_42447:1106-1801(+)
MSIWMTVWKGGSIMPSMVATAAASAHTCLITAASVSKMKWWNAGFLGAMFCWKLLHSSPRISVSFPTSMAATAATSGPATLTARITHFMMWGFSLEPSCARHPKRLVRKGWSIGWRSWRDTRGTAPSLTVRNRSRQHAAYVCTMMAGDVSRMLRIGKICPYASFGSWLRNTSRNLRRSAMRIGFLVTFAVVTARRSTSTCRWKKPSTSTFGLIATTPPARVSDLTASPMNR